MIPKFCLQDESKKVVQDVESAKNITKCCRIVTENYILISSCYVDDIL
jgi:hypothetical protein